MLLQSPRAGLDTEFYEVDFESKLETIQHRAQVHVWSVALPDAVRGMDPRGFSHCNSYVLPGEALIFFKQWLESERNVKYTHHAPAEEHPIYHSTQGQVQCRGLVDTLSWARWACPERHPYPGFGLKPLVREFLGREPVGEYATVFSEPVYRECAVKSCSCGLDKCRKRKLPDHAKVESTVRVLDKQRKLVPLRSIVAGHSLWPTLVEYSGADAEYSYQLADYLRDKIKARPLCL